MTLRDWLDSISTWATGLATVIGTFLIWRELRNRARENEPIIECHLQSRKAERQPIIIVVRNRSHAIMTVRRIGIRMPSSARLSMDARISVEERSRGPASELNVDIDVWPLGHVRESLGTGRKSLGDRESILVTVHLPSIDWSGRIELALWIESAASSAEPSCFTIRKQVAAT